MKQPRIRDRNSLGCLMALCAAGSAAASDGLYNPLQESHFLDTDDTPAHEDIEPGQSHRGNWFTKRDTVQESFAVLQQIQSQVSDIELAGERSADNDSAQAERQQLFWSELNTQPADMVSHLTAHSNRLDEQLKSLTENGAQAQAGTRERTDQEQARLKDQRMEITRIEGDLHALTQLQDARTRTQAVVQEQMAVARQYEQSGMALYDRMVQVLNDELVLRLAGQLNALLDSTRAIYRYIDVEIQDYRTVLAEKTEQVLAGMVTRIESLREAGVDVTREPEPIPEPEEPVIAEPAVPAAIPWWQRWFGWVGGLWSTVRSIWS